MGVLMTVGELVAVVALLTAAILVILYASAQHRIEKPVADDLSRATVIVTFYDEADWSYSSMSNVFGAIGCRFVTYNKHPSMIRMIGPQNFPENRVQPQFRSDTLRRDGYEIMLIADNDEQLLKMKRILQ